MKNINLLVLSALLGALSCQPMSDFKVEKFFQLDSMLISQSILLSEKGVTVTKSVNMDDEFEEITFRPDTTRWAKEFQIIKDFSLNKTFYIGAFDKKESEQSTVYIRKPKQPVPITRFEVRTGKELEHVSGQYFEDKDIFQHERNFVLTFDEAGLLSEYKIWGFQKMILQDTINYSITGSIGN